MQTTEHPNRNLEFVLTKKTGKWKSQKTNGKCITIVGRNMGNNKSYVCWPDDTFKNFSAWDALSVGDIFTDVGIYDEKKKRPNSSNSPRITGHIDITKEDKANKDQTQMFEDGDVEEETTSA